MIGLRRFNIFCDLDGVLVDFDRGFIELCGSTIPMHEYEAALGEEAAWDLIKRTPDFWKQLFPMPGSIQFWEYLKQYNPVILTSPSSHDTDRAIVQKRAWVDHWLGKDVPIFFRRAKKKCQFASPDAILIDDWENNIKMWDAAGGIAIHHIGIANTKRRLLEVEQMQDIHSYIRVG